jgi:secreted trypsin-like serine protease
VQSVSKDIKIHEDYDGEQVINDVGLIKLPESVTFNDAIKPVSLPSKADADNDFAGETARVSGWGLTDGFDTDLSEVLNYVDVEVISNEKCEDTFDSLLPSILCTSGDAYTGSCSGDSGGPLIKDDVQIGVVSLESSTACLDIPLASPESPASWTGLPPIPMFKSNKCYPLT